MAKYKLLLMLLLVSSSLFVAGCIDEDLSAEQMQRKCSDFMYMITTNEFEVYEII